MKSKFQPKICEHCHQTETYRLGLDKGSVEILLELLNGIVRKGVNEIHPTRELDWGGRKKWLVTNLSRPRFHGLIAKIKNKPGYYALTRKAGQFLRGAQVPRYAIVSKVTKHQEGYLDGEVVTIHELLADEVMWEGADKKMIDYLDPVRPEIPMNQQISLFR